MINFHQTMLKVISDYKLILRKNLSASQCAAKIRELGIKRKYMHGVDDVGLYKIGLKIKGELKKNIGVRNGSKRPANFYCGTEEFLQYLEKLFMECSLENGKVIHVKQKSSCALVAAIQLLRVPEEKMTPEVMQQIKQYSDIIVAYGNDEQKKILIDAVHLTPNLQNIFI